METPFVAPPRAARSFTLGYLLLNVRRRAASHRNRVGEEKWSREWRSATSEGLLGKSNLVDCWLSWAALRLRSSCESRQTKKMKAIHN